jgi:hypothetical protein
MSRADVPLLRHLHSMLAAADNAAASDANTTAAQRRGHGRQRLPQHLIREQRVYELTAAERRCPGCGQERGNRHANNSTMCRRRCGSSSTCNGPTRVRAASGGG